MTLFDPVVVFRDLDRSRRTVGTALDMADFVSLKIAQQR